MSSTSGRLTKIFLTTVGLLLLGFFAPPASALPKVECYAWLIDKDSRDVWREEVKTTSYDPHYREVSIEGYTFGVDDSYLPTEGIGLIAYNDNSDMAAEGTVGFRRIGNTKHREANLNLLDTRKDGHQMQAGVVCSYTEP